MKSKLYRYQWNCDYCKAKEITESTDPEGVVPAGWCLILESWVRDEEYYQTFPIENKLFCPYCQKSRYFQELQMNQRF